MKFFEIDNKNYFERYFFRISNFFKMRILNFTISLGSVYSDVNASLVALGHSVDSVYVDSTIDEIKIENIDGVNIIRVPSRKVQKASYIKKAIAFFQLPFILKNAVKKYLKERNYDLITFMAPPVTMWSVVNWAKKFFNCSALLMQKDIFPQNAVDLNLFSKRSLPYLYFRYNEKKMLKVSDYIGCMSQANIDYIRKHNPEIPPERVIYYPNTSKIIPPPVRDRSVLGELNIPENACVFLFGGNMGIPQYIDLLCMVFERFKNKDYIHFLCIGSGTHFYKIKDACAKGKYGNVSILEALPKDKYDKLSAACDVGMVFLDPRFTIPNYPSKTLSYMLSALPIFAATDTNTDYRDLIESQAKCGVWVHSAKKSDVFDGIEKLARNPELRREYGCNGREYVEKYFSVKISVEIIENLLKR